MIPHSNRPSPMMDSPDPIGSGREADGLREFGTSQIAAATPTTTIGTLTRNTDPHQKWASRNPPRIGPMATPIPVDPDQMPMALARSASPVNTLVRMDSVDGMRAAAPTPMTARASVNRSGLPDRAAAADPPPNTRSPPRKTHLRPSRSPRAPIDSRRPANTTA